MDMEVRKGRNADGTFIQSQIDKYSNLTPQQINDTLDYIAERYEKGVKIDGTEVTSIRINSINAFINSAEDIRNLKFTEI